MNQRTAWKIEQKIRQSLKEDLDNVILSNVVEADTSIFTPQLSRDFQRKWDIQKIQNIIGKDNYTIKLDRVRKANRVRRMRKKLGLPSPPTGRPKGSKNIAPARKKGEKRQNQYYKYEKWVLGIVERKGKVYLQTVGQHSTDINSETIAKIISERVTKGSKIVTDGGGEFDKVNLYFSSHDKVIHEPWIEYTKKDGTKGKRQIRRFVNDDGNHTNTIESTWAHLKRIQWGNHIQISYGHANRYLYEFAFQRNNRELSDAEKFQFILRSALKMSFPYPKFKIYTRIYKINEEGKKIGERVFLIDAA